MTGAPLTGHRHLPLLCGCISSTCASDAAGGAAARREEAVAATPGLGRPRRPRPWGTLVLLLAAASEAAGLSWLLAAAPTAG